MARRKDREGFPLVAAFGLSVVLHLLLGLLTMLAPWLTQTVALEQTDEMSEITFTFVDRPELDDPEFDHSKRLRRYGEARDVRMDVRHRMLRTTEGVDSLRRHFRLGVNFIESLVNRHRIEIYILDAEGRIAASFERIHWDEQQVVVGDVPHRRSHHRDGFDGFGQVIPIPHLVVQGLHDFFHKSAGLIATQHFIVRVIVGVEASQ